MLAIWAMDRTVNLPLVNSFASLNTHKRSGRFGAGPSHRHTEKAGVNYRVKRELKRWMAQKRRDLTPSPRRHHHLIHPQHQPQQCTFVPQLETPIAHLSSRWRGFHQHQSLQVPLSQRPDLYLKGVLAPSVHTKPDNWRKKSYTVQYN